MCPSVTWQPKYNAVMVKGTDASHSSGPASGLRSGPEFRQGQNRLQQRTVSLQDII